MRAIWTERFCACERSRSASDGGGRIVGEVGLVASERMEAVGGVGGVAWEWGLEWG